MARLGVAGGVGIGGLYGVRLGEAEGDEVLGAPLMQVRGRWGGGNQGEKRGRNGCVQACHSRNAQTGGY